MERLAIKFTDYLIHKGVILQENRNIYQFGFQVGFEVVLNTVISILIAIICKMEVECIVFFLVFIPLRSYAGGLQLDSYFKCMVCSCLSLLFILLIVKYININSVLMICTVAFSIIIIKIIKPVEHINRPVSRKKYREFVKKLNITLMVLAVTSTIFFVLEMNRILFTIAVTMFFMAIILFLGKIKRTYALE